MRKWKVGIVGLSRGKSFVSVFGAHSRVEVTALCDVDREVLARTGEAFELDEGRLFTDYEGEFLDALDEGVRPPIDVVRAMDFTVPGIIAHESAMKGGEWLDVPRFDW